MFVACTCKQRGDSCGCLLQFVSKPHALISKWRFKRTTLHWFPHLAVRFGSVESDPVLSVCVCAFIRICRRALPVLWKADAEETGLYVSWAVRNRVVYRCSSLLSFTAHDRVYMRKCRRKQQVISKAHVCTQNDAVQYPLYYTHLPVKRKLISSKSCSEGNQFLHVFPFNKEMPKCWKPNLNNFFLTL